MFILSDPIECFRQTLQVQTKITPKFYDGASTQALKPMDRVNRSPKQRVPVAPQNGDLSPQKSFPFGLVVNSYQNTNTRGDDKVNKLTD